MKRVAVINLKGGVGKTTTAVNIAACLGQKGKRVLLADLDPQGNASLHLGFRDSGHDLLNALQSTTALPVRGTEFFGLQLVPSGYLLSEARHRFSKAIGRDLLKRALKNSGNNWDWVIFDCPPSIEILTQMALHASQSLLVPIEASFFGLTGLEQLIMILKESFRKDAVKEKIMAVVPCRAHPRRRIHKTIIKELHRIFPDKVAPVVRETVALTEAPQAGKPVIYYSWRSAGSRDYQKVTDWILAKVKI